MRIVGKLKLNHLLPTKSFKFTERIDNNRLGVSTKEEKEMVRSYRLNADRVYLEWAINEILNWKNQWVPENIIHIHGAKDKIFPATKLKNIHIVKDATHMMVYRAKEVSDYINNLLR
ncbi:MAG: alpha/beta hydrolase, partial [Chitinophagaceae bacterium]